MVGDRDGVEAGALGGARHLGHGGCRHELAGEIDPLGMEEEGAAHAGGLDSETWKA
jgi:hypothetical protein